MSFNHTFIAFCFPLTAGRLFRVGLCWGGIECTRCWTDKCAGPTSGECVFHTQSWTSGCLFAFSRRCCSRLFSAGARESNIFGYGRWPMARMSPGVTVLSVWVGASYQASMNIPSIRGDFHRRLVRRGFRNSLFVAPPMHQATMMTTMQPRSRPLRLKF